MNHCVVDGFKGFRSRFDDIELVQELLEDIPIKLGLQPIMPPFILPYYNGVDPEDCGISAFLFLAGGHFTLHTFSFRECFFADLFSSSSYDWQKMETFLKTGLPCATINSHIVRRSHLYRKDYTIDRNGDFGPHLFIDITDYEGPTTMDELFDLFDVLPQEIDMTPIMRPYALKSRAGGMNILSIITMIAESHISLHVFPDEQKAFFDLFSCRFFDEQQIISKVKTRLPGTHWNTTVFPRGKNYNDNKGSRLLHVERSKAWLASLNPKND